MADLQDVENLLVSTLAQTIYPNGTSAPSIVTATCRIYRGWPVPLNLDNDLSAGILNISVFPTDIEQNKTRYTMEWHELPITTPSLTATVSGTTVTIDGTASVPLNVAVKVNNTGYVYAVQSADTPTTIATALASLINADTPASNTGPVISIPAAFELLTAVGTFGTIVRETKRQKRTFQITFWCPTPTLRDAVVPPCDRALADLTFISLPDGSAGRIRYERSAVSDRIEKVGLYRRDLFYSVEYPTTDSQSAAQIVTQVFNISGGLDPDSPLIKTFSN